MSTFLPQMQTFKTASYLNKAVDYPAMDSKHIVLYLKYIFF